nr:Ig-like domain-containing protein [Motilibacter deserti]
MTLRCQDFSGAQNLGEFTGTVWFTSATSYQTTQPIVTTTLALSAAPAGPVTAGARVTLTAVVAPVEATGSVQFFDNGAALGKADVAGGRAQLTTATLGAGTHSFTAAFSGDVAEYLNSTSAAVGVRVDAPAPAPTQPAPAPTQPAPAPTQPAPAATQPAPGSGTPAQPLPKPTVSRATLAGKPYVASKVTCNVTVSGAASVSYAWLRDGKPVSGTAKTRALTKTDLKHTFACRVTATNASGTTVVTSAAVRVGPAALKAAKAPSVAGKAVVGGKLTAKAGTWSPKATSVKYQWLRDGKAISGAKAATYTLKKADKGHTVSVQVTAARKGSSPGVAVSRGLKVK